MEREYNSNKDKIRKKNKRSMFIRLGLLIVSLVVIVVVANNLVNTNISKNGSSGSTEIIRNNKTKKVEEEPKPEPVTISIDCIGDVMMHDPQIKSMKNSSGEIDLSDYFKYVKPIVEKSDLAICNIETTFAGKPYTGYPMFCAPDELATEIKNAGFDVAATSNNHMIDKGTKGVQRTIEIAKKAGLEVVGSRTSSDEKDYIVVEVNGINVGIVAYTYETPKVGGNRTINANTLSDELRSLVNSYNVKEESDQNDIIASISGAKEDGAQIIVCYFHWGEEYQRKPDDNQKKIAKVAADNGADIIFASHPHVPQPMEFLTSGERKIPVYWSMGNYVSNQRSETLNNKYTEQGIIAQVEITFDLTNNIVTEYTMSYTPLWVDKYNNGSRTVFAPIPLIEGYKENEALLKSKNGKRATAALKDLQELMGEPQTWNIADQNDSSSQDASEIEDSPSQ